MDRPPAGRVAPMRAAVSNSSPSQSYLFYLHPIVISTGEGSIVILPILPYRRPTGGESFGLDNHLVA